MQVLKLPSPIMRNFIVMPVINLPNRSGYKFTWYRRISAQERKQIPEAEFDGKFYWNKVASELYYCPSDEDVAHYVKVVCLPSEGPKFTCVSKTPVEIGPTNCPFEKRHLLTMTKTINPREFRVMSYNILADCYADSDHSRTVLFGHCPPHALELGYRRQLLLKEISGYNADLICLQEVDRREFARTYEPFLNHIGNYSGIFNAKGDQLAEGQATFYRNDKYEFIESHKTLLSSLIEPPNLEPERCEDQNSGQKPAAQTQISKTIPIPHPFLNDRESQEAKKCLSNLDAIRDVIIKKQELRSRFVDRHTILQTTLLKARELDNIFLIVANTHLYFAPDADHVRLLQGSVCVKYLEYIKEFYKDMLLSAGHKNPKLSIVFCGDMNSTPDCGLYQLLTEGQVGSDLPDWSSNKEEEVVGLHVRTNLRFSSAYKDIKYTNYTLDFNGCLDYIYYEQESLICESVVPLPDHEDVTAIGGIPSDVFPSDHIALVANLKHS